jgi:hypothetical protein
VRLLIPVAALKPLLLFLLLLPAAALAARDTSNITNPRHVGSWIVDEGNVLTPAEKGALDGQLMQLEHEIGVEFPVAISFTQLRRAWFEVFIILRCGFERAMAISYQGNARLSRIPRTGNRLTPRNDRILLLAEQAKRKSGPRCFPARSGVAS